MTNPYQNDEDASDEADPELPNESDLDPDDEYAETIPCPKCRKPIYEQSEFCPHCGIYLSVETMSPKKPLWLIVAVIICLAIILICWLR